MSMDEYAMLIGYGLMSVLAATLLIAIIFILVAWINEQMGELNRAARNTYWWSRWIRWNRMARHRKALRARSLGD